MWPLLTRVLGHFSELKAVVQDLSLCFSLKLDALNLVNEKLLLCLLSQLKLEAYFPSLLFCGHSTARGREQLFLQDFRPSRISSGSSLHKQARQSSSSQDRVCSWVQLVSSWITKVCAGTESCLSMKTATVTRSCFFEFWVLTVHAHTVYSHVFTETALKSKVFCNKPNIFYCLWLL